jgi:hypothetical protein
MKASIPRVVRERGEMFANLVIKTCGRRVPLPPQGPSSPLAPPSLPSPATVLKTASSEVASDLFVRVPPSHASGWSSSRLAGSLGELSATDVACISCSLSRCQTDARMELLPVPTAPRRTSGCVSPPAPPVEARERFAKSSSTSGSMNLLWSCYNVCVLGSWIQNIAMGVGRGSRSGGGGGTQASASNLTIGLLSVGRVILVMPYYCRTQGCHSTLVSVN